MEKKEFSEPSNQAQNLAGQQVVASPLRYSYAPYQPYSYIPVQEAKGGAQQIVGQPFPGAGSIVGGTGAVQQAPGVGTSQFLGSTRVDGNTVHQSVRGESRIEYVPYEKVQIEYEPVQRTEYVAKEKKVTDYYAVEYQTEYVPQVYQDRYIEYLPQEKVVERVEYQAVERQVVHQPQPEVVQSVVQQPIQQVQYVQQQPPVQTVQYIQQQPQNVQYVQQPPVQYSYVQQQSPVAYSQYVPQGYEQAVVEEVKPQQAFSYYQQPVVYSQGAPLAYSSYVPAGYPGYYQPQFQGGFTQVPAVTTKTVEKVRKVQEEDKGILERLFD